MNVSTSPAIEAAGVVKSFGPVRAVAGIDLLVERGSVVALLGPNGAGKTTFLDTVLGFTAPTSGTVRVFGERPGEAVRAGHVGAVLQTGGLLDDLTVRETIAMIAACHTHHLPCEEVAERAGVAHLRTRRVRKLSGGEQQRLRFALALLSDPGLLVLDEPTAGMDVGARAEFWAAMHAEADRGRTIVFATHYLQEAADFADRIVLLRDGRLAFDGTLGQLGAGRDRQLTCRWRGGGDPAQVAARTGATLRPAGEGRVLFSTDDTDALARLLLTEGIASDLEIHSPSLDDIFRDLTSDTGTGDTGAPAHTGPVSARSPERTRS